MNFFVDKRIKIQSSEKLKGLLKKSFQISILYKNNALKNIDADGIPGSFLFKICYTFYK